MVKFRPETAVIAIGIAGRRNQVDIVIVGKAIIGSGGAATERPGTCPGKAPIVGEPRFNGYRIAVSGKHTIGKLRIIAGSAGQRKYATAKRCAAQQCNVRARNRVKGSGAATFIE